MKKLVLLFTLFYFLASAVSASNILLFEKANQLYRNQMYERAASLYMQMIQEGYSSANIYYNAGNAFFKLKKPGITVWCYEKALQIEPNFKNAKDNLIVTRTQLKVPNNNFQHSEKNIFYKLLNLHSINNWSLGALLFLILYAVCFILRKASINKPILIVVRKLSLFLFLIYFLMSALSYTFQCVVKYAICITNTQLKTSANINSRSILEIKDGEKLKMIDKENSGYIKVSNGKKVGFVSTNAIKEL